MRLNEVIRVGPNPIELVSLEEGEGTSGVNMLMYVCMGAQAKGHVRTQWEGVLYKPGREA